jgi:hypothetical protein
MLELDVVVAEAYDEQLNKFVPTTSRVHLEHSLASMSKWESVFEKPFLGPEQKSDKETLGYIELMIVGPKPPPEVFLKLVQNHMGEIQDYISKDMTATKISEIQKKNGGRRQVITNELIYSWMVGMQIPFETEHWHLNRLIMLIRVIGAQNAPKRKMTNSERQQLNRQRQAQSKRRG